MKLTGRVIPVGLFISVWWAAVAFAQPQADATGDPFPLEERLRHYVHRTYSWQRMALLGADTAFDHIMQDPHEWSRSPGSFTYRYSSAFGRRLVANSIELGVGFALREDTRFRKSQKTGFISRVRFASEGALLSYDTRGNRTIAYSRLAATTGGILIHSAWHPCRRSPQRYLEAVGNSYLGHLENSLLTEFSPDMIRLGKKVRLRMLGR